MGSICSCCFGDPQDIYEDNATNDKSNLLNNPVGDGPRISNYCSTSSNNRDRVNSKASKIDDQAKLNRILQDTAKNYIDVPALNSPIDQPNYSGLEKQYGSKVQELLKTHQYTPVSRFLVCETNQVENMLSVEPLSKSDRQMVSDMYAQILAAMSGFQVNYSDTIIIPFDGYPKVP